MFPLLNPYKANPLELFQIWLNLPAMSKMAEPHFTMFWAQDIPSLVVEDGGGLKTFVSVVAGQIGDEAKPIKPLSPPPDSWAAQPEANVAIWTLRLQPGARYALPPANAGTRRNLYFF